ncbi:MAG: alpha/beta fold hydrolase, partial [Proteobacteria bacterium]|nr:alpha/beta fold hydrolase [Pseudomonadota bacterium]
MTDFSRRLRHGHAYAFLMASAALVTLAPMAHAQDSAAPAAVVDANDGDGGDEIVVIGSGQTRSVSTLVPQNLDLLPPGTSVQKALNFLPVVTHPGLVGRHATLVDNLGTGLSDHPTGFSYSMEDHAETVAEILDSEQLSGCTVVGHSMGGMVATYYLSQPLSDSVSDRIEAVVTIDSPLRGTTLAPPASACLTSDTAWRDIRGESDVLSWIDGLRTAPELSKLFAINATVSPRWRACCQAVMTSASI